MESVSFGIYIVEGMMHINKIKKIIVSGKKIVLIDAIRC